MATALALDHLVLVVGEVERSLAWYGEHAGLEALNVDAWRQGHAFFPSLRITEDTIIDFLQGDPSTGRGHLDHLCFVVSEDDLASIANDPALEVVDRGARSGARGLGTSVYVHDPDGLLVEFRCYPQDG